MLTRIDRDLSEIAGAQQGAFIAQVRPPSLDRSLRCLPRPAAELPTAA